MSFASSIRGHLRIRDSLERMIRSDHLHPSLIFSGTEGIGKHSLALQFAMALQCQSEAPGELPCSTCAACYKVAHGSHADVIFIAPESDRKAVSIAQIRAMLEEMSLTPVEGKRRVFCIELADRLSAESMNTLLKTLEEPPGRTVTLLLTTRPSALLDTIHSRCQHHRLRPLAESEVIAVLQDQGLARDEAERRARFAAGSPGRALDDGAAQRGREAEIMLAALADGRARRDPMDLANELLSSIQEGTTAGVIKRQRIAAMGAWLQRALRDLLVEVATGSPAVAPMAPFAANLCGRLSGGRSPLHIRRALEAIERSQAAMDRNQHLQLGLEGLIIELAEALTINNNEPATTGRP